MNLERIKEMEASLDVITSATKALNEQLTQYESIRDQMITLFNYYGSDDWYEDCEGELPEDVKAGVLSEDAVYDEIMNVRETSIRMMELATDLIKNRI